MRYISIGSWAYNIGPYEEKPVPWADVLKELQKLGFDGVELGGMNGYPNPDNHPTKEDRQRLVEQVRNHGLRFSGFAADLWGEKLINTDDQSHYIETFKKNAEFGRDIGMRGIRVDCTQPPTIHAEVDYDTAFKRVVNTWKTCCDIAADNGLYVTWEFEPGFAFNKPSDILRILDAVNKPNFGLMYDTCHAQTVAVVGARQYGQKETYSSQVEFLKKVSGKINHIHLIDNDNTCHKDAQGNDETSTHAPFGEGVINWDEVMPLLAKEMTGHYWWTIDLCFWADAWNVTAKCKKSVDELNQKYG